MFDCRFGFVGHSVLTLVARCSRRAGRRRLSFCRAAAANAVFDRWPPMPMAAVSMWMWSFPLMPHAIVRLPASSGIDAFSAIRIENGSN